MSNPYEYHNGILGVQARFLFEGRNAHEESLRLIGERGLRMRIERHGIVRLRPNAPGQPMLVRFNTLPDQWQNLLIKVFGEPVKQIRRTLFEQNFVRDMDAFDTYSSYLFPDDSGLTDPYIEEYTINASVLNTIGKVYQLRKTERRKMKIPLQAKNLPGGDIWETLRDDAKLFRKHQPHTLPDNPSRLRQKYNRYKKEGYLSLISGKHKNNNARVVTFDIEHFLNCLFADYARKPNMAEVSAQYDGFLAGYVEVINNETGEFYDPKGFPPLSPATITNYLSKWDNAIGTHAIRSGDRQKYMAKFKPYHSLIQPKYANSIISVDDRQPVFKTLEKNKRVWFYNGIDLGSEAFTCWVYGETKEGIITEFYRQMVRNYAEWGFNLPAELEGELSLNASFKDTFLKEGNMFQYVRIEANNARGKRIEQYYRPLRYKYEKLREGWLARPHALDESNQAGPKEAPAIPYSEIIQGCLQDIEIWNNTEHSKIKGKTRWEVFCEMQNPDVRPTNYRAIIPYLGHKTETSCNAGIIKLQKREWLLGNNGLIATGENLINLMSRVEGRDIDVYWLDGNDGEILKAYVYIGDHCMCEAIAKPLYNKARIEQKAEDVANRELMSKYVATVDGFGRQQRASIERLTVIDNRPRTLNNGFKINGLSRRPEPEAQEVEILEEVSGFEPYLTGNENGFKPSLRDRF